MTHQSDDETFADVEDILLSLTRSVPIDAYHKAHLRNELLRRHQVLAAGSQRAAAQHRSFFAGLKRLTLVAPPALALALVLLVVASSFSWPRHRDTQSAEAAQLVQNLARTVPTVTAWQAVVQESHGATVSSSACSPIRLGSKRLYLRYSRLYVYDGRWFQVTPASVPRTCSAALDWAFQAISLQRDVVTHGATISGRRTDVVVYRPQARHGLTYSTRAWIDARTGLLLRIQSVARRDGRIVSTHDVRYTYGLSRDR